MSPWSATLAALFCLAGQGCATDVVDFPLKSPSKDASVRDMYPGACKIVQNTKSGKRCSYCAAPGSDMYRETCEYLACKLIAWDGGSGKVTCKTCWWSLHPQTPCKMCWDSTGKTTWDSCFGKDAGS